MNGKKWLVLTAAFLVAAPAAYAYTGVQGDQVVTGHTVFNEIVIVIEDNISSFKPTDFAAKAGFVVVEDRSNRFVQRECVVWFNGQNLDQKPDPDGFVSPWPDDDGAENAFPSDEEPNDDDASGQDYDFDRDVPDCDPQSVENVTQHIPRFVVAVESGDCDPDRFGSDFRFRAHLDFTDPNGQLHEVQEYSYICSATSQTLLGLPAPGSSTAGSAVASALFPFSDCGKGGAPVVGPCGLFGSNEFNGTLQDLFRERLWITETHADILDPTIAKPYNFALQVDTCDGINPYDIDGKSATDNTDGYHYPGHSSDSDPGDGTGPGSSLGFLYTVLDLLGVGGVGPFGSCTDGSSLSFDDTDRGTVSHTAEPGSTTDIEEGNSWDGSRHRENCRPAFMGTNQTNCYPEDHKTALIDLYAYDLDPTGGQWDLH